MLTRKILKELHAWRKKKNKHALIISGARQIGKTFIVREFAKEYKNFIEINFLENPDYTRIFEEALDVDSLKTKISLMIPGAFFSDGDTLILLDEIQESGRAVQSLKFWTEDGRYDVIATGSALGMSYSSDISYPVGRVEYMNMFALDFEEFLWAADIQTDIIDMLKECYENRTKVPKLINEKIGGLLLEYMAVGGMPEVVSAYRDTGSLHEADMIQRRIYRDYVNDIAHVAPADIKIKAQKCYRSIPVQLTSENHKFQYSVVEHKATASKFGTSIDWLNQAYMTRPVYGVKRIEYPLKAYSDESNFRLYMTDIGLLIACFDFSLKQALVFEKTLERPSENLVLGLAKGGLYEALAADMLGKRGYSDIFFYKDVKNTSEIEFIVETNNGILPIEIKAGRKKANSLNNILKDDKIQEGYKLSFQNLGVDGKRVTLPLYMLMFL